MPGTDVLKLRNVALISHSGAGKTSLSEALLFNTKATTRIGRVEDGNTVSDYEPEEAKRGGSIQTSLIACAWDGHKVNFLDTPGYDDFLGEVISALRVVESATILVAATSGVDVGTERSWNMCQELNLPRLMLVNKMDRENASFARCVADIQATFGRHCVPFQLPIGDAQDFQGVVSIVRPPSEVPAAVAGELATARERLVEAAAEVDEKLADKYLEGEELTDQEVEAALKSAVLRGELVPILASSATQNVGVTEFLDMIQAFLPSPVEGNKPLMADDTSQGDSDLEIDAGGSLAAMVFKTTADPFVGKLSLFRVYRGTFKSNSEVWNSNRDQAERIGQLYLPRGKSQENVAEVGAGDFGAIGKLAVTVTGDTLCTRDQQVWLRLRQIALVAEKLAPVEEALVDVLGIEVCYRDPGVGHFGLENALLPIGNQLLEVVAPIREDTAGGRYLARRGARPVMGMSSSVSIELMSASRYCAPMK